MATIKVPVKVITFIHKDTGKTESFAFDDNHDVADSFEGTVFGEQYNVTGFYKVSSIVKRAGHKEVVTETSIEVEI